MARPRSLAAFAALSLTLGGCATHEPAVISASGDMTPTARDAYVGMAAAGDLFEIQSSRLALSRAQSPAVKDFAQMMIDHHGGTTAQLDAAARAARVSPPLPALLPTQARMIEALQAASATDFDRLYISQQVQAHEAALALHGGYARNGDTAALRTFANATTIIVQQHLDRARQLAGQ
jgi:putative membrane protein